MGILLRRSARAARAAAAGGFPVWTRGAAVGGRGGARPRRGVRARAGGDARSGGGRDGGMSSMDAAVESAICWSDEERGVGGTGTDVGATTTGAKRDVEGIDNAESAQQQQRVRDGVYSFWQVLPLYPRGGDRRTVMEEVVPGRIWTFDQLLGVLYVLVPIRMTVVYLSDCGVERGGRPGLLVYSPVAPTVECVRMLQSLERQCGCVVEHIVMTSAQGLEHKQFVGPFCRRFASAQVWVPPSPWSFPLKLPLTWLGVPRGFKYLGLDERNAERIGLRDSGPHRPFGPEVDIAVLGPVRLDAGPFAEVTIHHRPSRTLIVTDAAVSVPPDPPRINADTAGGRYALLFHARDRNGDVMEDNEESRREGWQKIVLFSLYFRPAALEILGLLQSVVEAARSDDNSSANFFGLFPWRWKDGQRWRESFDEVCNTTPGRKLIVAPILQTLVLNRDKDVIVRWLREVTRFGFRRVIAQHYANSIDAGPQDLAAAFSYIREDVNGWELLRRAGKEMLTSAAKVSRRRKDSGSDGTASRAARRTTAGGAVFTSRVNLPADDMQLLLDVGELVNGSQADDGSR